MDEQLRLILQDLERDADRAEWFVRDLRAGQDPYRKGSGMNKVEKPQVRYTAINVKEVLDKFAPAYAESIESVFNKLPFPTANIGRAPSPAAASKLLDKIDDHRQQLQALIDKVRNENP